MIQKKRQLGHPDEIRAKKISSRWNGIKRFHWTGWAGGPTQTHTDLVKFRGI